MKLLEVIKSSCFWVDVDLWSIARSSLFITWLQQLTCWSASPFANLCKKHHFSKISRHFPTLSVFKYVLFSSLTYRQAITETGYSDRRQVQYTASHVCRDISFEPTVDFKHNFWTNLITPVQNHCKWRLPFLNSCNLLRHDVSRDQTKSSQKKPPTQTVNRVTFPLHLLSLPTRVMKNSCIRLDFLNLDDLLLFFSAAMLRLGDSKKSATRFCRFLWEEMMESDQLALKMSMK